MIHSLQKPDKMGLENGEAPDAVGAGMELSRFQDSAGMINEDKARTQAIRFSLGHQPVDRDFHGGHVGILCLPQFHRLCE